MLGPVVAEYSLFRHRGTWAQADAWRAAHAFNAPLHASPQTSQVHPIRNHHRDLSASLPSSGQLLNVEGRVLVTAVKCAEDSSALIVRFVNQTPEPQDVTVRLRADLMGADVTGAERVNLREEPLSPLDLVDGAVHLSARPWEIVTLALTVRLATGDPQ